MPRLLLNVMELLFFIAVASVSRPHASVGAFRIVSTSPLRVRLLPSYCVAQEGLETTEAAEVVDVNPSEALRAQEVFVVKKTGNHECQACGYVYKEARGLPEKGIAPGTQFLSIEKFRCPQCGASKKYFVAEEETLSGFKENMKFGLGANSLTGDQKGLLIFGGLFAGFLLFMSGYLLN
jgi:rubredoxin